MLLIIRKRVTQEELKKISSQFKGYIKIVVDVERGVMAAGADRHFEEEKALLDEGSKQEDLWGGGVDLDTGEIDYNSVINLRPNQDNPSRDILSKEVREKFGKIVKELLL